MTPTTSDAPQVFLPSTPPSAGRRSNSASTLPGAIRKGGVRQRSSSLASRVLGKAAPVLVSSMPVLRVTVSSAQGGFDAQVAVSLEGARPEGRGLPLCRAGSTVSGNYLGTLNMQATNNTGGARGAVEISGFNEPVAFFLARAGSFVMSKGRYRGTALSAPAWDWKANAEKPKEGKAADIELSDGELRIALRPMTAMELKRSIQLQALQEAAEGDDYDTLRAQVTKARMASVEMEHIAKGESKLKELQQMGLHVNEGCDHATIRDQMSWTRVTSKVGSPDVNEPCTVCEDCPCNVDRNPGEVFDLCDDDVQSCLSEFGPDGDRQLFEQLVEAALAVEEGCIWKAGGKFIFSAFNRNQSVTALTRMLSGVGKQLAAEMLRKLVAHTDSKYKGYVTAIQVNFHPHNGTFHDQHRDIYSQKQSAGPNCTCQFQECIGTICYSIGSSRIALLTTMTDQTSIIRPCGDGCEGRREYRWLHSGNSMYFNTEWNANHTHGIPPAEEACGPRISLAFLIAAKAPVILACRA